MPASCRSTSADPPLPHPSLRIGHLCVIVSLCSFRYQQCRLLLRQGLGNKYPSPGAISEQSPEIGMCLNLLSIRPSGHRKRLVNRGSFELSISNRLSHLCLFIKFAPVIGLIEMLRRLEMKEWFQWASDYEIDEVLCVNLHLMSCLFVFENWRTNIWQLSANWFDRPNLFFFR